MIERFTRHLRPPRSPFGPGDDAAVLRPARGHVCITTDAVVEGVHFTRPAFTLADVGHKALAVNLSDLAAMGATPTQWLCSLFLPRDFSGPDIDHLARGMRPLARRFKLELVGGNITTSKQLSVSITALGVSRRPLLRSGARPGDVLYLSGPIGNAGGGLKLLEQKSPARGEARRLLEAQRRPQPRVSLGLIAVRFASAAIDVSDGLLADAGHLARRSGVAVALQSSAVPVSAEALRILGSRRTAMSAGEDYELLLAVPPGRAVQFERACSARRQPVARVGVCARGRGVLLDGRPIGGGGGFDHRRRLLTSLDYEP